MNSFVIGPAVIKLTLFVHSCFYLEEGPFRAGSSAGVIRPLIELDVAVHARLSSSESFHSWIELVKLEAERLRVVGHGFRGNRDRDRRVVPSPSILHPTFSSSFLFWV